MNVTARLEFELAYYDSVVHRFNHYTTRTPPRRNNTQTTKASQYDWLSHTDSDIRYQYTVTIRNEFNTLLETSESHILDDEHNDFVTAHSKLAAECILTKPRTKYKVPWESIAITEK